MEEELGASSSSSEAMHVGGTWMHKRVPRTSDKDKSTRRRRLLAWTTIFGKDRYQRRYFEVQAQLKRVVYYRNDPIHRQKGAATPAGIIEFAHIVRCTRGPYDPDKLDAAPGSESSSQPADLGADLEEASKADAPLPPQPARRVRRASFPSALAPSESPPTKWMFNLHCTNGRVFTMCTDSESTLDQWMQLMMSEIGGGSTARERSGDDNSDSTRGNAPAVLSLGESGRGMRIPRPRQGEVVDVISNASRADVGLEQRTVPFKDDNVKRMLVNVLQENILFTQAREQRDLQTELVDAFELMSVSAGAVIVRQGDCEGEGTCYVVESGEVVVSSGLAERSESPAEPLRPGSCFGELALMYDSPRAETLRALTTARLWTLQRATFRFLLTQAQTRRIRKYARFLAAVEVTASSFEKVRLADILATEDLEKLSGCLRSETYEPQQNIIRQGDLGDSCFIIEHGQVAMRQARGKGAMMTESVADPMSSYIHTQASALGPGQFFGEKALLDRDSRHASYDAANFCKCLVLARSDVVSLFGDLTARIERHVSPLSTGSMSQGLSAMADMEATLNGLTLNAPPLPPPLLVTAPRLENLTAVSTVGAGMFGPVKHVRHKESERSFALKCISKQLVVDANMQEHVLRERLLLQKVDSSFVVKIYGGLKDDRYLYFILEFLPGHDLYYHLYEDAAQSDRNGNTGFAEDDARIYAASALVALEHIHAHRIAHRDLKPENLVLDSRGYLKLVDFGLAKTCSTKTFTLCGTSDYLAPEIVTNEGHDSGVDLWALGVLIFELVCGATPFSSPDLMHKYDMIVSRDFSWSTGEQRGRPPPSASLKAIVAGLLMDQRRRLGNDNNSSDSAPPTTATIRTHPWFEGLDWAALERQDLSQVPIVVDSGAGGGGREEDDVRSGRGGGIAAEMASARCTWDPQFL